MRHATRPLATAFISAAALALGACNLAPRHERPPLAVPENLAPATLDAAVDVQAQTPTPSPWDEAAMAPALALSEWVQDARLRQLLDQALQHNRSLQQAVLNTERARALYGITQANQLPSVGLSSQATRSRPSAALSGAGQASAQNQFTVQLGLTAFELDFWSRVHNLSEAALQQYLAQTQAQHSARLSLVGDVLQAWLNLAADRQRLQLARQTLAAREKAHALTQRMHALGASSGLALAQSQTTVDAARLDVAAYTSQIAKDRHALELLAGGPVADSLLPGPADLLQQHIAAVAGAPAALPSSVLLRRPDVHAAEHQLRAMNAHIGAARANFFPRISLTAGIGTASRALSALFGSGTGTWNFGPALSLPLFDGGANRANLRVAEIDRELAITSYERTVQTAFREVADTLADHMSWQERLDSASALVAASQKALDLAQARLKAGADNQLSLLDAQRSLYQAQHQLISLRLAEQLSRVALYKALGGDTPQPP